MRARTRTSITAVRRTRHSSTPTQTLLFGHDYEKKSRPSREITNDRKITRARYYVRTCRNSIEMIDHRENKLDIASSPRARGFTRMESNQNTMRITIQSEIEITIRLSIKRNGIVRRPAANLSSDEYI